MAHSRGNVCTDCCCGGPIKCKEENCNGFIHLEVKDEVQVAESNWIDELNARIDALQDALKPKEHWDKDGRPIAHMNISEPPDLSGLYTAPYTLDFKPVEIFYINDGSIKWSTILIWIIILLGVAA